MADPIPTTAVNPYLTYNFRVKWDNKYVAAVTSVSGLTKHTAVVPFRDGGQPQTTFKIPGQTDYRQSLILELYDESGTLALSYNIYNCWPSEYTALPELNASANTVALASLTLEHEGWDRDPPLAP